MSRVVETKSRHRLCRNSYDLAICMEISAATCVRQNFFHRKSGRKSLQWHIILSYCSITNGGWETMPSKTLDKPKTLVKPSRTATAVSLGASDYTADKIQKLEGVEAVRKRPAMYIGDTGERGLHHLVYEVVDNSIDEALAGFCKKIDTIIHVDNSITVIDDGRGIPVDMHKTEKKPAVEVVLTMLHAGGKFDKKSYTVSGGLHGVGVTCVNALSEWLEVEVKRDGKVHHMRFKRGKTASKLEVIGKAKGTGTKITFKADNEIFPRHRIQIRHPGQSAARTGVPESRHRNHAQGRADQQAGTLQVQWRHRRIHQAHQPRQGAAPSKGHLRLEGEGRHHRRGRAAVQRRLQRIRLQLRQQHQHHRRRHAPQRLPLGVDEGHQPIRQGPTTC